MLRQCCIHCNAIFSATRMLTKCCTHFQWNGMGSLICHNFVLTSNAVFACLGLEMLSHCNININAFSWVRVLTQCCINFNAMSFAWSIEPVLYQHLCIFMRLEYWHNVVSTLMQCHGLEVLKQCYISFNTFSWA